MLIRECVCGEWRGAVQQHGEVTTLRCTCGVERLLTDLTAEQYHAQYVNGSYHESSSRHPGCVPYAERYANDYRVAEQRVRAYREKLNGQWREGMRTLDVGTANGAFVDYLQTLGMRALGLDPHPVRPHGDRAVLAGTMERPPFRHGCFDFVTYHDVLEHLLDPYRELEQIRTCMPHGGVLVIDVPDVSVPAGAKHYKPEHLWYFTRGAITELMDDTGFEVFADDKPIPGKLVVYGSAA